jgi:hypothetical protein
MILTWAPVRRSTRLASRFYWDQKQTRQRLVWDVAASSMARRQFLKW